MESKIAEKYIKDFPEGFFYRSGVRHAVEIAEQEMKLAAVDGNGCAIQFIEGAGKAVQLAEKSNIKIK